MSERITDERLAEIEHRWTNDGWILDSDGFAIIEALKAERAEVVRLTQRKEFWKDEATCYRDDYEAEVAVRPNQLMLIADKQRAEAKLLAVGELPGKWRPLGIGYYSDFEIGKMKCADELEALLK